MFISKMYLFQNVKQIESTGSSFLLTEGVLCMAHACVCVLEMYHLELAHVITEAEKSQDLEIAR